MVESADVFGDAEAAVFDHEAQAVRGGRLGVGQQARAHVAAGRGVAQGVVDEIADQRLESRLVAAAVGSASAARRGALGPVRSGRATQD